MKILQMSAYADRVGGAEIYLHGLADELERRGHTVGRFGTSPDRETDERLLRVLRRPRFDPTRLLRDDEVTRALVDFVARFAPDLIHVHNLYALSLDTDLFLGALACPVVQTVHDYSILCPNAWCVHHDGTLCPGGAGLKCFEHDCRENYPFDARMVLYALLRQRLLRRVVDVMICPSRYLADLLSQHGFREVCHVFNYVDVEKLALPEVARDERSLLYLGRLDPEKGVDILLEAMPLVLAEEPRTHLTVVGDGSVAASLRQQAADLGLSESVRFHAKVPYDEVARFYATATLMILPSIWCENSPLTAYECHVAGLPMVGARIGGIPDLVMDGETGYLVTPRSAADLATKVVKLLRSPDERESMSERLRERAKRYTREANVDQVEAIYDRLIRRDPMDARAAGADLVLDDDLLAALQHLTDDLERQEGHARDLRAHLRFLQRQRGVTGLVRRALHALAARRGTRAR